MERRARAARASTGCGTTAGRTARSRARAAAALCCGIARQQLLEHLDAACACRGSRSPRRPRGSRTASGRPRRSAPCRPARGRSSAVGCCALMKRSAGIGSRPTGPLVSIQRSHCAQVRLVDAAERREPTRGVAVHRRVADRGLGAVRRGQQHRVAQVGEHPDRRRAHARLDVLQRDVVGLPRSACGRSRARATRCTACTAGRRRARGTRRRSPRATCSAALRVTSPEFSRRLVRARQQRADAPRWRRRRLDDVVRAGGHAGRCCRTPPRPSSANASCDRQRDEHGARRRVGAAGERHDVALRAALAQVVPQPERDGARELLLADAARRSSQRHGERRPAPRACAPATRTGSRSTSSSASWRGRWLPRRACSRRLPSMSMTAVDELDVVEREAAAARDQLAARGDQRAAVVDDAAGLVAEQVRVEVRDAERARALDRRSAGAP